VIAGHVSLMFGAIGPYLPHIRSGGLRALAVTATKRAETLPDVPTMAEAGIADFVMVNWFGVFAPAGTPPDLVRSLNRDFVQALQTAEVKEAMRSQALDVGANSVAEFQSFWTQQIAGFQRVIDAIGLKKAAIK
jgi:tripartite-type tricarboxylate transporter receptor subunit TctC